MYLGCGHIPGSRETSPADTEMHIFLKTLIGKINTLKGGIIDVSLCQLAQKYNCNKTICLKCCGHLDPRTIHCHKKCGHTNNFRRRHN
ncbi:hypothetical protein QTO34_017114 [Cnephaeus nilssonii]|uniref:Ubiquitin-ribosomal protein eL40 fusion protein n=1 Tax=Cnephaeus nilssonii TaxID=3371016 RepID=A0AA40LQW4_CNENI|nr:hypothetical protein QTO34_017114 [Eptesicus nilssonii]